MIIREVTLRVRWYLVPGSLPRWRCAGSARKGARVRSSGGGAEQPGPGPLQTALDGPDLPIRGIAHDLQGPLGAVQGTNHHGGVGITVYPGCRQEPAQLALDHLVQMAGQVKKFIGRQWHSERVRRGLQLQPG